MAGRVPLGAARMLLLLLLSGCTAVFFQPMRRQVLTPDELGLAWRDEFFETADGVRLHGWFLPADGPAHGTVLFLHGNAENISTHIGSVAWLPADGFNVFLIDYRGYGLSEGEPDLQGLHQDVEAALATVFTLEGVDPNSVAVFGQSLGGAVAISGLARSAQKHRVRALIVEGAFADYRQITREVLARVWLTWLLQWPLSLTIDNDFRPQADIARIAPVPVLIVQGTEDVVVPPGHAETLYAAAGEPKALWLVPGAGHIAAFRSTAMRQRFVGYLVDCAFTGAREAKGCRDASPRP
jgi:uncharacterized protein